MPANIRLMSQTKMLFNRLNIFLLLAIGISRGAVDAAHHESTVNLSPSENDTISEVYWHQVDTFLSSMASNLEPQLKASAPKTEAFGDVSEWNEVLDNTTQPYTTMVGAAIVGALVGTDASFLDIPSQEIVSAELISQCPMIMFGNTVNVTAPHCGEKMGQWTDSQKRTVLRWAPSSNGNIEFGVDSVVHGKGSATFAHLSKKAFSSTTFSLMNCLKMTGHTVEENILKVNRMGAGESTARTHDESNGGSAFFLRYVLKHMNGSTIAATNLYRVSSDQVNISFIDADGLPTGTVAVATRSGWSGKEWRDCTDPVHTWTVEFILDPSYYSLAATIDDIRVATVAMFTLAAFRDETRSLEDGFVTQGAYSTISFSIELVLVVVAVILAIIFLCWVFHTRRINKKCKKLCFRLETAILPVKHPRLRVPTLTTTY